MQANQRHRIWLGRTILTLSVTLALVLGAPAAHAESKLSGYVAYEPGADFNRCVVDAGNVLHRLNARGEMLGWHYTAAGYTDLVGTDWHIQGIQRLPYYWWDTVLRGQYFVATFSHPRGASAHHGAHLGVARLDFKGGKEGKALGTNRAYNENWNGKTADWNVTPNPNDSFIPLAGTPQFKIDEHENHPGGISTLGGHVVVPLEKYSDSTPFDSNPLIKIYDLWDPGRPVLSTTFQTRINGSGTNNMAAAITKLSNGRFLLAVNKTTPVARIEYYVSTGTEIKDPYLFGADNRWPDATSAPNRHTGWHNINFITDCNGDLYLLGFRGGSSGDWIDMWKIDFYEGGTWPDPYYRVATTVSDSKHLYCSGNNNVDQCDFKAAAGSYVDPNGRLIVYATGYDNDGGATSYVYGNGNPWFSAYESHGNYLRGMEFREREGHDPHDPTGSACPTLSDAWAEFYEHPDFNSYGGNAGQVYRVEYDERDAKNGRDLGTNHFNDKASSIRWCIPLGHSFKMYRDPWTGPFQHLNGIGNVRCIHNLNGRHFSYGGGNSNDAITSYSFQEYYSDSQGWTGEYAYSCDGIELVQRQ